MMFKKMKFGPSDPVPANEKTIIGQSAVVVGNIVSQDLVQLKGHVVGNIDVNGSPNAQLSVLSKGHVKGDINPKKRWLMGWSRATLNRPDVSSCTLGPMSKAIFLMPRWRLNTAPNSTA
jgi:hypothetical protein